MKCRRVLDEGFLAGRPAAASRPAPDPAGASCGCGRYRRAAGYTLLEALVVVTIVGLTSMIGIQMLGATVRRQKLVSAASDLRAFAQRAQSDSQTRNSATFLVIGQWNATSGTSVAIVADTNGNGQLDASPADDTVASYTLAPEFVLSGSDATGAAQDFSSQWAVAGTGSAARHYLECDFQGRAFNPVTLQQVAGPATVALSRSDMITGSLTPLTVFSVRIAPIWNATAVPTTGP